MTEGNPGAGPTEQAPDAAGTQGEAEPEQVPAQVPVLFLDLDDTVRHGFDTLGRFVNGPEDVVPFPEAIERMREWRAGGGRIIGVTNQGGIALGRVTYARVAAAVARTVALTEHLFDTVQVCPHHEKAAEPLLSQCWCRKPLAGMLVQGVTLLGARHAGAEVYPAHLALMVGDRAEDSAAAKAAGVRFQHAEDWRAGRTPA